MPMGSGQAQGSPTAPTGGKGGATPNMFQQASQAITGGMAGAANEMGYQPMMAGYGGYNPMMLNTGQFNVGAGNQVSANGTTAAQTTQADIDRFYNPYTSQVIDTSLADIEKARMQQQNAAAAQATAAGAFGGSRGALMEAQVGSNALEQAAQTAAQLRSQGFTQAANLAQQDVARRQQTGQFNAQQALQAALANQQTGLQAGLASAGNQLQAALANQGAGSRASEFGLNQQQAADFANQAAQLAGSQQRLSAGNQLANIGNLGFGQAQSVQQNMQQQGMLQQALQQRLVDAAGMSGQYGGFTGAPQQSLQNILAAIGGVPIPSSTTQGSTPGVLDIGTSAAMMFSLFSDSALKTNVQKIGKTPSGLNLYKWDWNDKAKAIGADSNPTIGVMAQEAMEVFPEAVIRGDHGYLMVNYGAIA